ncbi:MAG: hypoxanthine/guanine phosphoribosyltransferase [Euryarchaeota archaeon]|nr:hypoxanthine/guanine phosphoribosyltransferase [Euryarchaeota archaeon]
MAEKKLPDSSPSKEESRHYIKDALEKAPVIKMKDYTYFVTPLEFELKPELIKAVATEITKIANLDVDKIVTAEAKGICVSTAVSLITGLPVYIARKRKYGLKGEIEVTQKTGYGESKLYLNGINPGDRVLVLDDLISTGGTMVALLEALKKAGAVVKDIVVVFDKSKLGGSKLVKSETGFDVKSLFKVDVQEGKVIVT